VLVIKSRRMRWAGHVAHRREGNTGFWWGNLRERVNLGDLGMDGRIMLMDLQGVGCVGMDWIELAQGRDRWRVLVIR
jgi:hypothetical protein